MLLLVYDLNLKQCEHNVGEQFQVRIIGIALSLQPIE
jgi:hypothetical protein